MVNLDLLFNIQFVELLYIDIFIANSNLHRFLHTNYSNGMSEIAIINNNSSIDNGNITNAYNNDPLL